MTEIIIAAPMLDSLRQPMGCGTEWGAAIFLQSSNGGNRFLVERIEIASAQDVLSATENEITFAPQFLTRVTREARRSDRSVALMHSHPSGALFFSAVDDKAESRLVRFISSRNPAQPSFSMVWCDGQLIARKFGEAVPVPVRVIGSDVVIKSRNVPAGELLVYDRQIRAFGQHGQALLGSLTIAIVGLGGTGSVLAQQLSYLGVSSYILIDDDNVDLTNLNRVIGANSASIGRRKIDVAAALIKTQCAHANIELCDQSVISSAGHKLLSKADCIFICTDSHSSRAFVSEFAYQYLTPTFDIGVSLNAENGQVKAITGRAQMLAPGLPCLLCSNALSALKIREELMTPEQRAADSYFNGAGVVQPSVISLNSTMVSLAVTMFLSAFLGVPSKPRWQRYDGIAGTVRVLATKCDPDCGVCGNCGIVAAGDSRQLSFLPVSL
jgi:molybdopterin-synthase adenylyltransferase